MHSAFQKRNVLMQKVFIHLFRYFRLRRSEGKRQQTTGAQWRRMGYFADLELLFCSIFPFYQPLRPKLLVPEHTTLMKD